MDVFAQCFDGFVTPKLFAYALCRLEGTFEVPEMLIGLLERNNSILRMGGCLKFEMDDVCLERNCIATAWGINAVVLGKQSTTISERFKEI